MISKGVAKIEELWKSRIREEGQSFVLTGSKGWASWQGGQDRDKERVKR